MPEINDSAKDWTTILNPQFKINSIYVTRYMGTKINLLDFLIPNITKELKKGDTVLDIMAGTNSIGYALKSKYRIFSNDVQTYSYWIGKALIENNEINISRATALKDLEDCVCEVYLVTLWCLPWQISRRLPCAYCHEKILPPHYQITLYDPYTKPELIRNETIDMAAAKLRNNGHFALQVC